MWDYTLGCWRHARAEHRPAITGLQDEQGSVVRFEQYDSGINVDGFDQIHDDFFDHLVLLPGVQLQQSNPGRETLSSGGARQALG